jgi:hypothetical protein
MSTPGPAKKYRLVEEKPSPDWPKSVKSFSKQLKTLRHDLKKMFHVEWNKDRDKFTVYKFRKFEDEEQ